MYSNILLQVFEDYYHLTDGLGKYFRRLQEHHPHCHSNIYARYPQKKRTAGGSGFQSDREDIALMYAGKSLSWCPRPIPRVSNRLHAILIPVAAPTAIYPDCRAVVRQLNANLAQRCHQQIFAVTDEAKK